MESYDEQWVCPFDDAFDDCTKAFPYGTYGHTAPMVRTPLGSVRRMLAMLPAAMNQNDQQQVFIDIGCGDGQVLNAVAVAQPSWQIVGVDISPETLEEARKSADAAGISDRVHLIAGDYRTCLPDFAKAIQSSSFSNITVFLYLIPSMIRNPDFKRDVVLPLLEGGARIVVSQYLPGQENDKDWPFRWKEDDKLALRIYWKQTDTDRY